MIIETEFNLAPLLILLDGDYIATRLMLLLFADLTNCRSIETLAEDQFVLYLTKIEFCII